MELYQNLARFLSCVLCVFWQCFLLHLPNSSEEGKSWRDAQSICSSFQGTLVAIEDEIEQAYITMLLQGRTVGVWIGLRDEDTMKWTNGKPVSYTNWSPVEPKNPLTVRPPQRRFEVK